ncbi:MAG: glycosyltransferase family 4 protein [Cytophagales bacterium]|nr:glycosyltransferase family 4 protein [Cytophagales bacterium]
MRVFAFHLLNDYSGSPKVLMQLVRGWSLHGLDVTLVTSSGKHGFLTDIPGVRYVTFRYRFHTCRLIRLINLTVSQLSLAAKTWSLIGKNDIVYINTVLPFGAAILGKLKRCRVIYHMHETTMKPAILKKFLFGIARWGADEIIYVSKYLAERARVQGKKTHILYNALEEGFLQKARKNKVRRTQAGNVLMVCSLKDYKGVHEFVALANLRPEFNFTLVVNASEDACRNFFRTSTLSSNLRIFPTQTDLHPFYGSASVVLNLSRIDGWIETFGLTVIEGMAYGLPAIVPTVGGITELVEDGKNGFLADSRKLASLAEKLDAILCNPDSYRKMARASFRRVHRYREDVLVNDSISILTS